MTYRLRNQVNVCKGSGNYLRVELHARCHVGFPEKETLRNIYQVRKGVAVVLWLTLFIFLLLPTVHAQEGARQEDIGTVLNMNGEWFLEVEGQAPERIFRGRALPPGGIIRVRLPKRIDSIEVALFNGKNIGLSCRKEVDCNQPILLPESIEIESRTERILRAFTRVWERPGKHYVSPISRGLVLKDDIIKLEDGRVDLSPAFESMERGTYHLDFRPVVYEAESSNLMSLGPVDFKWEPDGSPPIKVNGLKPGLYRVRLLKKEKDVYKPKINNEAWILFVESEHYEETLASFKEAVELTSQWDKSIKRSTVRDFLRAYLEFLAEQGEPSPAPQ